MRKLAICMIIVLGGLLSSCEKEKTDTSNGIHVNHTIILDGSLYNNTTSDDFELTNAEVIGDSLKLTISYGGGCGNVEAKLIDSENILESSPIQRNIKLSLKDNDNCEAFLTKVISFDLTPIRLADQNQIILNLEGWDSQLTYDY